MPTKTVRCSSMTLPCKCGLGPERLSGFGTAVVRAAPALSRAFEPKANAGWPPPLASPVSFRRATQTYKAVRRAGGADAAPDRGADGTGQEHCRSRAKEAEISEQSYTDECLKQEIFFSLREAQIVTGFWQNTYAVIRT